LKLSHAAALALVGWYLMVPPWARVAPRPDEQAPVSKWSNTATFDSAAKCNEALAAHRQQEAHKNPGQRIWISGKCVSTDDPWLKGN
jgi:hypothetical protein